MTLALPSAGGPLRSKCTEVSTRDPARTNETPYFKFPKQDFPIQVIFEQLLTMKKEQYTYLLARLPMGLSFFGHGLIRIMKLDEFSGGMVKQFSKSFLPEGFVSAFGHVLPFLELTTGLLLLLGLFMRFATVLGIAIIMALIFGSSVIEQWPAIFTQLGYAAYLCALFYYTHYNRFSVDGMRNKTAL
jgi:thiosulfate dehydrogenase [quinone] large subunit